MKNIKKNSIIIFLITIIVLIIVLKDDFSNILNALLNVEIYWIVIAIVLLLIYWLCKAIGVYCLAKEYKKDVSFKMIMKETVLTQFFSAVTPFSTGGEPMAIYMLKKSGIKLANSTSIIVQNFLMYQLSLVLYGIIAVCLNYKFNIFSDVPLLRKLVILGFLLNLLVCIILVIVTFSKKFNKKILNIIVYFANKLKFVKDKDVIKEKYQKKLEEFHESSKLYKDKKLLCVEVFISNMIGLGVFYLIPLFVLYSFKDYTSLNAMTTFVSSAYVFMIGSFVPIPGGSGGVEYGFAQFFGTFINGHILSAALLIWRFITYYITILIGSIVINVNKGEIINENRNFY